MARRRRPFSTPRGAQVLKEVQGVRGYSRRRAERVYELTVDYFARNRHLVLPFTWAAASGKEALLHEEREAAVEAIVAAYVPGLLEWVAWAAAKYFIRWLVRRLLRDTTAFSLVVEDLAQEGQTS